jgi:hypothetical protein
MKREAAEVEHRSVETNEGGIERSRRHEEGVEAGEHPIEIVSGVSPKSINTRGRVDGIDAGFTPSAISYVWSMWVAGGPL